MKLTALILAAALLSGCSTVAGLNQQVLAQGKPIAMFTLPDCAGYVVQSGLVVPVGQRMEMLDQICIALTRAVATSKAASAP
jgi:predicted small secreted protein